MVWLIHLVHILLAPSTFAFWGIEMLPIHPPVAKPCEPPAGIAKLCGALSSHEVAVDVLDANLEGLLSLLRDPVLPSPDTWTRRRCGMFPGIWTPSERWRTYNTSIVTSGSSVM